MALPPFQTLLAEHGPVVHRFLIARVGRTDADDCYQEAMLSALRAYPRLRSAENLGGWLITIAHHKAIDHLRAQARRPRAAVDPQALPGALDVAGPEPGPGCGPGRGAGDPDPVWEHVAALPEKQRTAIALRFIADFSHAEIAAAMGTREPAARRSLHEGLTRLRKEIQR